MFQNSDCREAGATGGSQMKTITISLPDVEAAMLVEAKKSRKIPKILGVGSAMRSGVRMRGSRVATCAKINNIRFWRPYVPED